MKRFTLVLDCGCMVTMWAEHSALKQAGTKCEEHHDEKGWALQGLTEWRSGLEGKKIAHVSFEPSPHHLVRHTAARSRRYPGRD